MIFILFPVFRRHLTFFGCRLILSNCNFINEVFFFAFFPDCILCALSCYDGGWGSSTSLINFDSIKSSAKLGAIVESTYPTLVFGVVLLIIGVTINEDIRLRGCCCRWERYFSLLSWLLTYYIRNFVFFGGTIRGCCLWLLLFLFLRSLLNDCVLFSALNHSNFAEVAQEVGPHYMMLLRQVLTQLRGKSYWHLYFHLLD